MRSIAATKIHEELHGRLSSRKKKIRNSNQLNPFKSDIISQCQSISIKCMVWRTKSDSQDLCALHRFLTMDYLPFVVRSGRIPYLSQGFDYIHWISIILRCDWLSFHNSDWRISISCLSSPLSCGSRTSWLWTNKKFLFINVFLACSSHSISKTSWNIKRSDSNGRVRPASSP